MHAIKVSILEGRERGGGLLTADESYSFNLIYELNLGVNRPLVCGAPITPGK